LPTGPGPLTATYPLTRLVDSPLGPVPPVLAFALVALGLLLMVRRRRLASRRELRLEEAKATFIRVASHELRTPLTVVRGYLAMAAEGSLSHLSAEMEEVLRTISGNVDDLHRLAELLLEAAQIDSRQLRLDKTFVDLRDVVRKCVQEMEGASTTGPSLVLEAAQDRVPVRADPDRLRTMVVTLLQNAFRRSPPGGEVRCSVLASGRQARVAVTDQGPPIPAEDLPGLFTRFGSSSLAGGHVASGGLGLYLVRELARLHGGAVGVQAEEGAGSTFTLMLPRARRGVLRRGPSVEEPPEKARPPP
jgi:MYXO-CTERM domain-containing protein